MIANTRIQWFHKKLTEKSYPNAARLAERFHISHRQAQRDVDFLRKDLEAPVAYDAERKGFYYTAAYSLPILAASSNDESYLSEFDSAESSERVDGDAMVQMQIPYTATVEISEKLAAIELNRYIVSTVAKNRYLCEFHSVDTFLGILFASGADIKILEPGWLRERAVKIAFRMLANNT